MVSDRAELEPVLVGKKEEMTVDRKLSVLIMLWILDKCVMVLLFWAFS